MGMKINLNNTDGLRKILRRVAEAALMYPQFRGDLLYVRARIKDLLAEGRIRGLDELAVLHMRLTDLESRTIISMAEEEAPKDDNA